MEPNDYLNMESRMKGMAMIMFTFFSSLCEAGFEKQDALYLAQSWSKDVIEQGRRDQVAKENDNER